MGENKRFAIPANCRTAGIRACSHRIAVAGHLPLSRTQGNGFVVQCRDVLDCEQTMTHCELCPRRCLIHDKQTGFCSIRTLQNGALQNGRITPITFGKTVGFAVDPIEKKPLNHFYPGSNTLSFGGIGCNLACTFCQNAATAQSKDISLLTECAMPDDVVRLAKEHHCESVAFTYNEPIISAEFVQETAAACRKAGIKTIAVSNGYISGQCRSAFFDSMDAVNIDLKSFSEDFYRDYCGGPKSSNTLDSVKETLRYAAKQYISRASPWLEVTTLLIPSLNDSDQEIEEMCHWFVRHLGQEFPLHFSAFRPAHNLQTLPATPSTTLFRARNIAISAGLRYVYTGNIDDPAGQSTYCPQCSQTVILRVRYRIDEYKIDEESCCKYCGQTIAGCFLSE